MKLDVPDHRVGAWQYTPWWLAFFRPKFRRQHWRWVIDHHGCCCTFYWQYSDYPSCEPLDEKPSDVIDDGMMVA